MTLILWEQNSENSEKFCWKTIWDDLKWSLLKLIFHGSQFPTINDKNRIVVARVKKRWEKQEHDHDQWQPHTLSSPCSSCSCSRYHPIHSPACSCHSGNLFILRDLLAPFSLSLSPPPRPLSGFPLGFFVEETQHGDPPRSEVKVIFKHFQHSHWAGNFESCRLAGLGWKARGKNFRGC